MAFCVHRYPLPMSKRLDLPADEAKPDVIACLDSPHSRPLSPMSFGMHQDLGRSSSSLHSQAVCRKERG